MAAVHGEHLTVAYGARRVFESIEIALQPGRFTALIGPNGSGKSSLLRVLGGVQAPTSGRVTSFGKVALLAPTLDPPGDLTPFDLAAYGLSVHRRFWQWALPPQDVQRILDALARCNLKDRSGEPLATLSAGEVQRAWIAAALASAANVLLIDEPTTHLDLRFQVEVLRMLRTLTKSGIAIMAAIHDVTLAARFADDIALIANGTLAVAPPDELLESTALTEAFGIAVSTHRHPDQGYLVCLPS